jgi:hypothetical protein
MNSAKEHCRSADLVLCLGTRYRPYYSLVIAGIVFASSFAEISILKNIFDLQYFGDTLVHVVGSVSHICLNQKQTKSGGCYISPIAFVNGHRTSLVIILFLIKLHRPPADSWKKFFIYNSVWAICKPTAQTLGPQILSWNIVVCSTAHSHISETACWQERKPLRTSLILYGFNVALLTPHNITHLVSSTIRYSWCLPSWMSFPSTCSLLCLASYIRSPSAYSFLLH